ncbi:MAG: hypothetical protein J7L11_08015 [Thermoprotei archaeon]|nr:hypothetical protein [Thermoprotei archaeon]
MGLADMNEIKKYVKSLKQRKKDIENRFMELLNLKKNGKISDEEYEERRKKLEREYVEVMDRLAQMRYFTGEEQLFA